MAGELDITEIIKRSELPERKAFVKEIVGDARKAVVRYTVPMPDDSHMRGANSDKVLLSESAMSVAGSVQKTAPEELSQR